MMPQVFDTFAGDGLSKTNLGTSAFALAIQSDGKIVVAGWNGSDPKIKLFRFGSDGTLDESFFAASAVAEESSWTVLNDTFHLSAQPGGGFLTVSSQASVSRVARHAADGSFDANLNSTQGFITARDNLAAQLRDPLQVLKATGVTTQSDGKVLVSELVQTSTQGGFDLYRYNPDGSLDSGFGARGGVVLELGARGACATQAALQPDQKIVIATSYADADNHMQTSVYRYGADGVLDPSFGQGNGRSQFAMQGFFAKEIALLGDGGAVILGDVYGSGSGTFGCVRINSDGTLKTSFGVGGLATWHNPSDLYGAVTAGARPLSLAVQSDGKILMTGFLLGDFGVPSLIPSVVARLNSDGTVDTTFGGGDGSYVTNCTLGSGIGLQSDGKIVVPIVYDGTYEAGLMRISASGVIDANNSPSGTVAISGVAKQGRALQVLSSLADQDGLGALAYQWKSNGSLIAGATESVYTLNSSDVGKVITATVSYVDGRGTTEAVTSAPTSTVTAATSTSPSETSSSSGGGTGGSSGSGSTSTPVCFSKDTAIATLNDAVAIQDLHANALLKTLNGPREVRWVGHQHRTPEFAKINEWLPVRIAANAISDGQPLRDLYVSPDHALLIDGHLIHAKALVNGTSIVQMTDWDGDLEYFHVETEEHEIIYAEGVPCETFIDNVSRRQFDNYAEFENLYPNATLMRELDLPRVKFRRQLPSHIARRLSERARELGFGFETVVGNA